MHQTQRNSESNSLLPPPLMSAPVAIRCNEPYLLTMPSLQSVCLPLVANSKVIGRGKEMTKFRATEEGRVSSILGALQLSSPRQKT